MRWIRRIALALLVSVLAIASVAGWAWFRFHARADAARPPHRGTPTDARAERPAAVGDASEILFGDLHVHTSYSADAQVYSLPLFQGEGAHPPADACDFARFCSGLDFWSINDHAEQLTAAHWRETKAAIRECNAIAGDPDAPDLVSFLGWEWSQNGFSPETHFGHRNVVLRDTEEDQVPVRPIAASTSAASLAWGWIGLALSVADPSPPTPHEAQVEADFFRYLRDNTRQPVCPEGIDVRALPDDCKEGASDPATLFEKLEQWGFPSLVIPHGLAWGTTNPRGATLEGQLGAQHDPTRQRLLEVFSGHGSSERYAAFPSYERDAEGEPLCPAPTADFEPCCFRAGEIVRARCDDPASAACEAEVEATRRRFAAPSLPLVGPRLDGATLEDWGDCDQLRGAHQPAYDYRPRQSAQMALALRRNGGASEPDRFRFGFIGSSDNHRGRPGTGYKEIGPAAMTDGLRPQPAWSRGRWAEAILAPRRADSFYYTGGLVAVHAQGRDRGAIFDALDARTVYGTTGPRIRLWFDALPDEGRRVPMGAALRAPPAGALTFEVRAEGARIQRPGCPESVWQRLGEARTRSLCLGECHHPGDGRHPITRIEVVRVRPQQRGDEAIASRIDDPWKVLPCPADGSGCRVRFDDPTPAEPDEERIYYVRAFQAPTPAINGDPLRCERNGDGACVRARPCRPPAAGEPWDDDCRSPLEAHAFSSPIYVAAPAAEPPRTARLD